MSNVRPCGCTYRAGDTCATDWQIECVAAGATSELFSTSRTWGELCNALRCNTYEKRDALHRVLHRIATPEITPARGPGRRGTTWTLKR